MSLQTPPPSPPSLPLPFSFPIPPLPFFPPPSPPPPPPPPPPLLINFENKISPSVLLIIVILAVIFFISGLLHLLVRFLLRPINREPEDSDNGATVLQGQLQQLFHLHDAGVDQSYIDTLPVFLYKAIIGCLKDPFDCAVCLCEFEPDDKLRLLPKCSHAFHLDCIDTWLLSHSTCPLCRTSLLPDYFSPCCSPMVLVLESGNVSSREICSEVVNVDHDHDHDHQNMQVVQVLDDVLEDQKMVVPVKLGKFRSTATATADQLADQGSSSSVSTNAISSEKIDQRRCFSMGSFEYIMDDRSLLQVAIKPATSSIKKNMMTSGRSDQGHFKGFHSSRSFESSDHHDANIGNINVLQKKESFSFSKIWLKDDQKHNKESSRMVLSRTEEAPSFARRTLLWIVGRQSENKVLNHV